MYQRAVLLSVPQLQVRHVTPGGLASLERIARRGGTTSMELTFPGLAASAFTTLVTGVGPNKHGILGTRYYDRERRELVKAPVPDEAVEAPRIWQRLREVRPGARVLLWFPPTGIGADVDYGAWLDGDGIVRTRPEGLAAELERAVGPFPRDPVRGEPPRLAANLWMLRTASLVIAEKRPELAIVRVPYLGQIARRYGPDGREAGRAVRELESGLAPFLDKLGRDVAVLAATETLVTPVGTIVRPNLVLRELGLLELRPAPGGGTEVDFDASAAFAVTDDQLCHVYVNDKMNTAVVASVFASEAMEGIAGVVTSFRQKVLLGIDHPRVGDAVVVAQPDAWFAPDWWENKKERPARDQSGLLRSSMLGPHDEDQVAGSLGGPPPGPDYLGVLVSSDPPIAASPCAEHQVVRLLLDLWPPGEETVTETKYHS